jgi:hypothetical protein
MIRIDLSSAMKELTRDLDRLERQQVPFATARALTDVARKAAAVETASLPKTFDSPTRFTLNAFAVIPARKSNLTATLLIKDRQAQYLGPYEDGGKQWLGTKRGMLTPKNVTLNAYGNLTKGRLKALKGRRDVFIGVVQTKEGPVNGVWQRLPYVKAAKRGDAHVQRLKLLIRFTDPQPVKPKLRFRDRAEETVRAELPAAFRAALAQALATSR